MLEYIVFAFTAKDDSLGMKYVRVSAQSDKTAVDEASSTIQLHMKEEGFTVNQEEFYADFSFIPVLSNSLGDNTPEQYWEQELSARHILH